MDETAAAVDALVAELARSDERADDAGLPVVWAALEESGLSTVGVPEGSGGSGGTLSDLTDLARSLGRHAISAPLLEHATARWALSGVEGAPAGGLLTVSSSPPGSAPRDGAQMTVRQVPWARHASHLLVVDAAGLTLVDLAHESVDVEGVRNEAGEPRDNVTFGRDAARSLEAVPSPAEVTNRLGLLWSAAVAGAIEGTYRLTRDYVNSRHQFGAPLVKIPAVAALLATVKVELVQVDASLARARREMADEGDLRRATAAVGSARVVSARAATVAARSSHQLHGAMGITAEYPLHRHTTQLWAWRDEAGSELEWATGLGDMALSLGEEGLWDALTN